jgi:hypothetical protein
MAGEQAVTEAAAKSKRKKSSPEFVMVYQKNLADFAGSETLRLPVKKLMLEVIARVGFGNTTSETQADLARTLNMDPGNVSAYVQDLEEEGWLRRVKSKNKVVIRINPYLCWKGSEADAEEARRTWDKERTAFLSNRKKKGAKSPNGRKTHGRRVVTAPLSADDRTA